MKEELSEVDCKKKILQKNLDKISMKPQLPKMQTVNKFIDKIVS
jgi:hypothetical protein